MMKEKKNIQTQNKKSGKGGYLFLGLVVLAYAGLSLYNAPKVLHALKVSARLILEIVPVLLFVILIMALLDYFLKPEKIKRIFGREAGLKGWLIAIAFGIVSHGSVYAWYPLLRELRSHGMREGLIAVFIYNRAIKIPFIPLMIYYFGLKFFVVLTFYMIIASVIEGLLIEKI